MLPAVLAIALLSGLLAGCGSSSDSKARKLMQEGNDHLANAAEEIRNLSSFDQQWRSLFQGAPSKETALRVRDMLETARENEKRAAQETKFAGELYDDAKKMDISKELKEYASLKRRGISEQEQLLEIELKTMEQRITAIKGQEAGQPLNALLNIDRLINELEADAMEHAKKAAELYKEANAYYEEHQLAK